MGSDFFAIYIEYEEGSENYPAKAFPWGVQLLKQFWYDVSGSLGRAIIDSPPPEYYPVV